MILTSAPLRCSFFGGGSDVPEFFLNESTGGSVVSTAIDKYVYVAINKTPNNHIKVSYNNTEIVKDVDELKHDRIREALKLFNITSNIEISSFADIPSAGSGLGSSSSFTAALLLGLKAYKRQTYRNTGKLFEDTIKVEIDLCKNNIGWQDQAAACYGGFNQMFFTTYGLRLEPIDVVLRRKFEKKFLMFRIGKPRDASEVLSSEPNPNKHDMVKALVDIARKTPALIRRGRYDELGELMHESWMIKRETNALVTNDLVDEAYEAARKHGAMGGKLCGAGHSGHLLFMVEGDKHEKVIAAMEKLGLVKFPFTFTADAARILYNSGGY